MRMRMMLGVGVWVSAAVGLVMLSGRVVAPVGATVLLGAAVIGGGRGLRTAQARLERLRSWPRPGEVEYPAGPRRVPLLETGLAGPE
jgi:hypothetical protein